MASLWLAKLEKWEKFSGFPNPTLYNQYFVNSYAFPKGLHCIRHPKKEPDDADNMINAPIVRKGIQGWKLSRAGRK